MQRSSPYANRKRHIVIGTIVGQYKIVFRIGGGDVGEVYPPIDLGLQRDAAIECLRPELSGPEEVAKRFRNEARTLAKLSHPDIATTYQFFTDNDRLYLVMEYSQGTPFGGCLKEKGGLYSARRTDRVGSGAARRAEAAGEGARGC